MCLFFHFDFKDAIKYTAILSKFLHFYENHFSLVRHPSHPGRGHGSLTCHMTQFEGSDWLRSANFINIMVEYFTHSVVYTVTDRTPSLLILYFPCKPCFVLILHYNDVIMSAMASQITGVSIVYSTVCSGVDQRKHQRSTSLAFVRGIHRWPRWPTRAGIAEIVSIWWRHLCR